MSPTRGIDDPTREHDSPDQSDQGPSQGDMVRFASAQLELLEKMAQDAPLTEVLERLVSAFELSFPGMRGSVLLSDASGHHLNHVEAPRPPWGWSVPIVGAAGGVLGKLAFRFLEPRSPTAEEVTSLERGARIASFAIERQRSSAALAESQARMQRLVAAASVGLWDWDLVTNEVFFSREWKQQLGYEDYEVPNTFSEWRSRLHPDDDGPTLEKVRAFKEGRRPSYDAEFRLRHRDGSWRWIYAQADFARNAQGVAVRMMGSHIDITERKEAEAALRESEERFRNLVDSTAGIVWEADADTLAFTYVSKNAERLLGYPVAEWSEPDFWPRHIHASDREQAVGYCVAQTALGLDHDFEYRFIAQDGRVVWLRDIVKLVLDSGAPRRLRGLMIDVSHSKATEQALRWSQSLLQAMSESSPLGMLVVEARTNIVLHANRRFCELWGLPEGPDGVQTGAVTYHELLTRCAGATRDPAGFLRGELSRRPRGKEPVEDELLFADGRVIRRVSTQIRSDDGGPLGRYYLLEDITSARRNAEQRTRLEADLQQTQKIEAVGRLAGGLAHDFNNMLGVILGNVQVALDQVSPSDPLYEDLDEIRKAAQRSADLTRQLLTFARKQAIHRQVVDLNDAVSKALKMLRRLIGEHIDLSWSPEPGLWRVYLDPTQLDQILANLCVNARDAIGSRGTITISACNRTLGAEQAARGGSPLGRYVLLSVRDNGCGMPSETLGHIFEPFFTTKPVGAGTGLGLATVYGTVQQNQGFVDVTSEPGAGTTFTLYFPCHEAEPYEAPSTIRLAAPGGRETILLVEDEPSLLKLAARLLERQGYTVLAAATPGQALAIAQDPQRRIDLLLTDVVMPEMNGSELARALLAQRPTLRQAFMSGYASDQATQRHLLDDNVHFLAKPFSAEDLARTVREALA